MKKNYLVLILAFIMVTGMFSLSGCKKISGLFGIEYIIAQTARNKTENLSVLSVESTLYTLNNVSGKIVDWRLRIFTPEDSFIMEINKDNYASLNYNIKVAKGLIQTYYDGYLRLITDPAVPGDMFSGETPGKVILYCTIEDMNGYRSEVSIIGNIGHEEAE